MSKREKVKTMALLLKDCSKEELIYLIEEFSKGNYFITQRDIEYKIRDFRWRQDEASYSKICTEESEACISYFDARIAFGDKYAGCRYLDVPQDEIKRLAALEKRWTTAAKKADTFRKKRELTESNIE